MNLEKTEPKTKTRIRYDQKPDFTRPLIKLSAEARVSMLGRLKFLYGTQEAEQWLPELERILKVHYAHKPTEMIEAERNFDPAERFTEKDMVLITYGDSIESEHGARLQALHKFVQTYARGAINTIHLLPFFPYSSDRGFSVVDFEAVDPSMGTWECVRALGADYNLMFDGVVNHCSSRSEMFKQFLRGNPRYKDYFITYDSPDELTADQQSKIFRPRTSELLTRFDTIEGPKYIWTTFSDDQIDFNFRNPQVLLSVIDALLFYVRRGADIIRLDAVTYIWSEPGTECVHLPETHMVVKLMRDVMDAVAKGVSLITETNVPHKENIAYFGDGYDEAHMVYNFALPPLVLHTFYTQSATEISRWVKGLELGSDSATYFNMLDTHDGIGVMGVKGILDPEQIDAMVQRAKEHGALISYKSSPQGKEPYEINATWWSAINRDDIGEELALRVQRHLASRAVAMAIKGVPGIYTHGALGLANNTKLFQKTGLKRDINRMAIDPNLYATRLNDSESKYSLLRQALSKISLVRTQHPAFHPQGELRVLELSPSVFSVLRTSRKGTQYVLSLINVTDRSVQISIETSSLGVDTQIWEDLVGGGAWQTKNGCLKIDLSPYAVVWLSPHEYELQRTSFD